MVHGGIEQSRTELGGQEAPFNRYLSIPWVESPFFETELAARGDLDEAQKEMLRHYNEFGYITLDHVVSEDVAEQIKREAGGLFNPDVVEGYASYYRIHDAWRTSPAVREVALNEKVLTALRLLYGRDPVPFQTLNFLFGSQQSAHPDSILFNSLPPRYMCGVWVALEDVDHDNGPLFYYPGSHKLPQYYPEDFINAGDSPDDLFNRRFPHFMQQLTTAHRFSPQEFHVKKGGVLIWASNLIHGGMPRLDTSRTRWSQVTHYFFTDCIYYVPLYSDAVAGEYFLRDVVDLRNNAPAPQTFNGIPFHKTPIANGRFKISFGPGIAAAPSDVVPAGEVTRSVPGLSGDSSILRLGRRLRERLSAEVGLFRMKSRTSSRSARRAGLPAKESGDMVFFVDSFEEKAASLSMMGWAFLRSATPEEASTIQIALHSKRECYLLDCQRVPRPDVANAHRLARSDVGFLLLLEKHDLTPGRYRVGLLIRRDGQEPALRFTDRTIDVP